MLKASGGRTWKGTLGFNTWYTWLSPGPSVADSGQGFRVPQETRQWRCETKELEKGSAEARRDGRRDTGPDPDPDPGPGPGTVPVPIPVPDQTGQTDKTW